MTTPKAAKGWAVFTPHGNFSCAAKREDEAKFSYCRAFHNSGLEYWGALEKKGYRCLPCTITVSEDER